VPGQIASVVGKSAVEMRLPTARLRFGEIDLDAKPPQ
jgi:hypothetical protein